MNKDALMPAGLTERLRTLMDAHKLRSNRELGELCDVSPQAVSRWFTGGAITDDNLKLLAKHFGVDWLWLKYGDEAKLERREHDPLAEQRRIWIDKLRINERRLRIAQELTGFGAWDVDMLTGTLHWDEQTHHLFGLTPQQAPKSPQEFFTLIWPEDLPELRAEFNYLIAHPGHIFTAEYRYTHPDGTIHWFRERARILRDDDGEPIQFIGTCVDITAEKHAKPPE